MRKARLVAELVDESHFMASIRRCVLCGQHFLAMFCERVDWADGDDPQTRIVAPVSEPEARELQAAEVAANEYVMLEIVAGERRFLYHDMPKGAPETLQWMSRPLFIPAHD